MNNVKEYRKKYYIKNREKILERKKQLYKENPEYSKQYYKNNIEKKRKSNKQWLKKNREYHKEYCKKYGEKTRIMVLNIISGGNPHCVRCGCNDIRLLEINHKNGGGTQEYNNGTRLFYRNIRNGKRKIDDLELLCKVCNAYHALELKFGKLPYKIIYGEKFKNE